jgi:hypothetical protein
MLQKEQQSRSLVLNSSSTMPEVEDDFNSGVESTRRQLEYLAQETLQTQKEHEEEECR